MYLSRFFFLKGNNARSDTVNGEFSNQNQLSATDTVNYNEI